MAHILLLEPDSVLARMYLQALRHVGHTVACTASAEEAVAAADNRLPELVILELQLAEHDGIEFLHEFRSYPEWQSAPVIINTQIAPKVMGAVMPILRRDLRVDTCLYKPQTSLRQLVRAVQDQVIQI